MFRILLSDKSTLREVRAVNFSVIVQAEDLNYEEKKKIDGAVLHWQAAFNSKKFESFILGHSWKETVCSGWLWRRRCQTYTHNNFKFSEHLTNQEIYSVLLGAKEVLGDGTIDSIAQIYLQVDRRNKSGVIGYTYPDTRWQWIYSWVLKQFSIEEIAGNLAHEYCHKLGFDDYSYSQSQGCVTYSVGQFVESF